jgi:hypothetical protein
LSVVPAQSGELVETCGAAGAVVTVALVLAAVLLHPFTVAVTKYVPATARLALAMTGFCTVEVNPFGPVQLYVAPAIGDALRLKDAP